MRKVNDNNKKTYVVLYVLILLAMLVGGLAFLRVWFQESWKLFWCDASSGFVDAEGFRKYFVLFWGCYVFAAVVWWMLLFGQKLLFGKRRLWREVFILPVQIMAILVIIGGGYIWFCDYKVTVVTNNWENTVTVGHSFGQVGEDTYTGSLEAFQQYYAFGQRTFEVDFAITADGRMVLKHDWDFPAQAGISGENIPTEEEFLQIPIWGKYTPLSLVDLCAIMEEYPDIWIVTDTKSEEPEQVKQEFDILVQTVKEAGCEDILDRLVIQVYNEQMYECLREYYDFKNYIYTFYQKWYGRPEEMVEICRYCVNNGIGVVAFQDSFYSEEMQEIADRYGLSVYLHTVNDVESAKQYLRMGATGIYTDKIVPAQLEEHN